MCYHNFHAITWVYSACNCMQTVKEFIEKVKANGNKDVTLYMYPGEGHGFMNGGQDIHKMMKSKFTPTVSDVHLTRVTAQQQNLIFAECTLCIAQNLARYLAARCMVTATCCNTSISVPRHGILTSIGNRI